MNSIGLLYTLVVKAVENYGQKVLAVKENNRVFKIRSIRVVDFVHRPYVVVSNVIKRLIIVGMNVDGKVVPVTDW